VFIAVAVTPVSYGEFRGGHGDTVKVLSHAAHGREAVVDGEHLPRAVSQGEGYRGRSG
jgi:hypothetical protein